MGMVKHANHFTAFFKTNLSVIFLFISNWIHLLKHDRVFHYGDTPPSIKK